MSILKPYSQLSDEQKEFVNSCNERKQNVFLEGPPWSGKSLTCLYGLQSIVKKNNTTALFMVTNNAMYGYMSMALEELGISENVTVHTKNRLFWEMAGQKRISVSLNSDYHDNYNSILCKLLEEEVEKKYSLIIVNEVQDYLHKEWELLKRISEKIVCYGDFKQAIYNKKVERETILNDCIYKELSYHYTDISTNKLIKVRNYFLDDSEFLDIKEDTPSGNQLTIDVEYKAIDVKYKDELRTIADILKALEDKNSRIAIICPDNNRFAELTIYLTSKGIEHSNYEINSDLRQHDFASSTPLFLSIFNAEGLMFDNVILFGFDKENYIIEMKRKENKLKNLLYVGMTRARDTTYIIRNENTVAELKEFDSEKCLNC